VSYGKVGRMLISPFFKSDSKTTLRRILARHGSVDTNPYSGVTVKETSCRGGFMKPAKSCRIIAISR
jgi:hypothetical protein